MKLQPITIRDANAWVLERHRHNPPVQGALFALAVSTDDGQLVGVAIVGRPPRGLQDGHTVDIRRVCTNGYPNACSFLYSRCRRAAAALGYSRVISYSRQDEGGASLRGAGFELDAKLPARDAVKANKQRIRVNSTEPAPRFRWSAKAR